VSAVYPLNLPFAQILLQKVQKNPVPTKWHGIFLKQKPDIFTDIFMDYRPLRRLTLERPSTFFNSFRFPRFSCAPAPTGWICAVFPGLWW
jgi:hypothetical protein